MGTPLDAIIAHFSHREPVPIEVPEWGLTVYVPPISLKDRQMLLNRTRGKDDNESAVEVLILFARDIEGQPLLTREDKPKLMRKAAPDIVVPLSLRILNAHHEVEGEEPLDDNGEDLAGN